MRVQHVCIGVVLTALVHGAAAAVQSVETTNAILSLKAGSGDLIGLQWKQPRLDIIAEGKLGENFRILVPRPDHEANYFDSRDQVVRRIDRTPNGIALHYGPLRNEREELDVEVVYEVVDTGGQLEFSIQVDNHTDRKVAEVAYALVGGQRGIQSRHDTETMIPGGYRGQLAPRLFTQFDYSRCCYGVPLTFAGYTYPGDMSMGWMDVFNRKAGLGYYYANQDPENRLTALFFEMYPYAKHWSPKAEDNWPSAAELPTGEPLGMTMGWVNFPYAGKGTFRAGPVALQVHNGDWRKASRLYRGWFEQHFRMPHPLHWLGKEMAWQSVTLMNPEDDIVMRFKDLPKVAADGKRYGVTTLMIFGWEQGGEDRGRPHYVPDSRLGTREEWRQALADIRAMGVHPLVHVNMPMADTGMEDYKTRYSRFAVRGRWAPDLTIWSFGPSTIGGRLSQTSSHYLTYVSPAHPEFREELISEYLQIIRDGAEGLKFDGCGVCSVLDFNPDVPTSPDRSMVQGSMTTYEEFLRRAREINPDVSVSTMDGFDRTLPYDDGTYYNIDANPVSPTHDIDLLLRHTFPEWNMMAEAVDPSMFDTLSNGLRYGLIWGIAPRAATASMEEPLTRPLSRYLSELIRIRKHYADLLFFGRLKDTDGAQVRFTGDKEDSRYSVFASAKSDDPRRAIVVVNFGDKAQSAQVSLAGRQGQKVSISVPFEPDRLAILPASVTLPPHRAAVVVSE